MITFYLYDYHVGMWCHTLDLRPDLNFEGAISVLCQKIEMEPSAENILWLTEEVWARPAWAVHYRITDPIDHPDGVKITVLPGRKTL